MDCSFGIWTCDGLLFRDRLALSIRRFDSRYSRMFFLNKIGDELLHSVARDLVQWQVTEFGKDVQSKIQFVALCGAFSHRHSHPVAICDE